MCGFFGIIGSGWRKGVKQALEVLHPRGPDEQSFVDTGEFMLGHTRLSVIDPDGGQQPMLSADGRYTIVFNGEIYNFQELRKELEASGHIFKTRSDTEVLLNGFSAWGENLLDRLDGMFALAVWDATMRRLFAGRDRMGIKPFYYAVSGGLLFGSTLAPFLKLEGFPRRLNWEALRDYLAYKTTLSPHSFLSDVHQLPPASKLLFHADTGRLEVSRYWDIPSPMSINPEQEELLERVDTALEESVRRQLVADVPLGAFLSGGIDSSLMVYYMAKAGVRRPKTFSVRFAEDKFDETVFARAVADNFGCEHYVLDAPDMDADALAASIAALDQPVADPSYIMIHELSKFTRSQVTVAISGDGGDEVFAGYSRYAAQEKDFPHHPGQHLAKRLIEAGLLPERFLRLSLSGQERMLYRHVDVGPWAVSHKSMKTYLAPSAYAACRPQDTLLRWRELANSFGGHMDTASLMRTELWTFLSEKCLARTDRASMAHSLEVRVPILGNPVLDVVLNLPSKVHFDTQGGKAILRSLARLHLPEMVWNRPKHGFSVPLHSFFRGAWKNIAAHAVEQVELLAPFLNAGAVKSLWRDVLAGRRTKVKLMYTLIVLLLWLEINPLDYSDYNPANNCCSKQCGG